MNKNRLVSLFFFVSKTFIVCLFFFALFSTWKNTHGNPLAEKAKAAVSFTFTASGDFSANSNTTAGLTGIKNSGSNFHVALGDFRYSSMTNAAGWGNFVKELVGPTFPFQIVSGNHDDTEIIGYVNALPNRIGTISGEYGKEYYFDYPQSAPIARFILTATNEFYSYPAGSTHYNWVSNAIDSARARGIKWIIVGHHKNCISAGVKSCEIGTDLMNLLINKRVDLVLQGHEHAYERSKQLRCAEVNRYTSTCVANPGTSLMQGAGTVFLVLGTGGAGLRPIDSGDTEFQYFAATNATAYGFGKFTVSDTQISYNFVRTSGGTFSDSVTIAGSTSQPTIPPDPTIRPSTSPTRPPTVSPTRTPTNGPTQPPGRVGDANGDGQVNIADAMIWLREAFLSPVTRRADFNRDGVTNSVDYALWFKASGTVPPTLGPTSRPPTIGPTSTVPTQPPVPTVPGGKITAQAETTPVTTAGDAADDMAIWIHPTDPSKSIIIGNDKKGKLEVYDINTGARIQQLSLDVANTDVRYNFLLGGQKVDIVLGFSASKGGLIAMKVNPATRMLEDVTGTGAKLASGGSCIYYNEKTNKQYIFVNDNGTLSQYELFDNGGKVAAKTPARTITFGSGPSEACVADDILGHVYVSDEYVGIWKLAADPAGGTTKTLIAKEGAGGNLTRDVEGQAIYYKSDGTGYLFVSNQGMNAYNIYRREGNNAFIGTFKIEDGTIDGTSGTDGIDITNFPIGSNYPKGLFIAQDGQNVGGNQNFKMVRLEPIFAKFGLTFDTAWDPRAVGR